MNRIKSARVHRFRDYAAIGFTAPEPGGTLYLTAKEARQLARILEDAALDIESASFVNSLFKTEEIEAEPGQ